MTAHDNVLNMTHCLTLGSVSKGLGHQGQLLRGAGLGQHLEGRIEDEGAEQG